MRAPTPLLFLAVLLALLLTSVTPALGGTPEQPEVTDPLGDADPLAFFGLKPGEASMLDGNLSMFDLLSLYIAAEGPARFWFVLNVHDFDGGITNPDPTVPVMTPPMHGTFDIHFTINDQGYIARAAVEFAYMLDPMMTPPFFPYFFVNYTLHKDDAAQTFIGPLVGYLSARDNIMLYIIPKDLVGSPQTGDLLSKLYAVSYYKDKPIDRAPDSGGPDPTQADPGSVDPARPWLSLLAPAYGTEYEFGRYRGSGAAPVFELTTIGETTGEVETGVPVTFQLQLRNIGTRTEEAIIAARGPIGWATNVDPTLITLPPGSSTTVTIDATPTERARDGRITVTVDNGYQSQSTALTIRHLSTAGGGVGTGGPGSAGPDQTLGNGTKDSPAPAVVPLLAALGVALAFWRRRSDRR